MRRSKLEGDSLFRSTAKLNIHTSYIVANLLFTVVILSWGIPQLITERALIINRA